jgi:hypothetical protein
VWYPAFANSLDELKVKLSELIADMSVPIRGAGAANSEVGYMPEMIAVILIIFALVGTLFSWHP